MLGAARQAPASDELLTIIPEQMFVPGSAYVRYPLNLPDQDGTVHVVFEQGNYGCGAGKDVFYIASWRLDDLNCDGRRDAFDIGPFVLALVNPVGHAHQSPDCEINNADINGDGAIDAFDIDSFVQLLTGG